MTSFGILMSGVNISQVMLMFKHMIMIIIIIKNNMIIITIIVII